MRAELEQVQAQFETAQTEWVRDKQEAETKRQALLDAAEGRSAAARPDRRPRRGRHLSDLRASARDAFSLGARGARHADRNDHRRREIFPRAHGAAGRHAAGGRSAGRTPAAAASRSSRKLERRLAKAQAAVQEMTVLVAIIEAKEKRRDALALELSTIAVALRRGAPRRGARRLVERLTPLAARAARLRRSSSARRR